jgi:hypothetical protein
MFFVWQFSDVVRALIGGATVGGQSSRTALFCDSRSGMSPGGSTAMAAHVKKWDSLVSEFLGRAKMALDGVRRRLAAKSTRGLKRMVADLSSGTQNGKS